MSNREEMLAAIAAYALELEATDLSLQAKINELEKRVTALEAPPVDPATVTAFPGAVGFGKMCRGGRGGRLIRVTNLNDSGTGSLRAALTASDPRTVVFDVGGTVNLLSNISITNPFLTVAGQTAPGLGVQVRGNQISVAAEHVMIRHLTIRIEGQPDVDDCLQVLNGSKNCMFDSLNLQWGGDECGSCNAGGTIGGIDKITWMNTIFAECMEDGFLLQGGPTNISFYRNLFAKNHQRHPRAHTNVSFEYINNISYDVGTDINCGNEANTTANAIFDISVINNRFIDGPESSGADRLHFLGGVWAGNARVYHAGNVQVGQQRPFFGNNSGNPSVLVSSPPLSSGIVPVAADAAFELDLLRKVGARAANRDPNIKRLCDEVMARKGIPRIPNQGSVAPYGAPVTYPTVQSAYVVPANPDVVGPDGYTNLERDLNAKAEAMMVQ